MIKKTILLLGILTLTLSACGGNSTPDPALDLNLAMTAAFATVNASFTQTALAIPSNTPAPTDTPTLPPPTTPPEFIPTVTLAVTINTGAAYCRFGPDTIYAYRFGLRYGKTLEGIGRTEKGDWLLVREAGGARACWVYASLLAVQGDAATLAVAPLVWPTSEKYPPPANVTATRAGDQVQIAWSEVPISEVRDIYPEGRYLLQVWTCNGGILASSLVSTNNLTYTFTDQPGCAEASRGTIYTTSREGYSLPAPIPWP